MLLVFYKKNQSYIKMFNLLSSQSAVSLAVSQTFIMASPVD